MRKSCAFLAVFVLLAATASVYGVTPRGDLFLKAIQVGDGGTQFDTPKSATGGFAPAGVDTFWYGGFDGTYAIEGGIWDFESGVQGWYGVDQTQNSGVVWGARVTSANFTCPADAPMILGTTGQLWFGKHLDEANAKCWVCDAGGDCSDPGTTRGYANNLCQRADVSMSYGGGDVHIDFDYFLDLEGFPYDYVKVQVIPEPAGEGSIIGVQNIDDGGGGIIGSPDAPAHLSGDQGDGGFVDAGDIPGGTTDLVLRFEFVADGGWSDEDAGGGTCSTNGPFGADNIVVTDNGGVQLNANFDSGNEGFSFSHCPGVGNFVDLNPVEIYNILDPCQCELAGTVVSFHDENFQHPGDPDGSGGGQANMAVSPIIDRTAHTAAQGYNDVFYWTQIYAWLPLNNGVLYRPGAMYAPWECDQNPGEPGWSGRVGQAVWWYVGADPACFTQPNNFVADGVPGNADYYRVVWELLSCCSCFGIGDCTGITNETPLMDNIRFGLTGVPDAPVISFGAGSGTSIFQDGFAQDGTLLGLAESTGRMDAPGVEAGVEPPYVLADTIAVSGPTVTGDTPSWEALLHFRVARKGPGQDDVPAYVAWRNRVIGSDGDPEAGFVSVAMDSTQLGNNAFSNKFCSMSHELDPYFDNGFADHTDENEILPDNVFVAGTSIEWYVTADFNVNQDDEEETANDYYRLPGADYYEVEILPSMRSIPAGPGAGAVVGWPALLYFDAFNGGAQNFIDPALNAYLPEIDPAGDDFPNFDRYDMYLASSNFNANSIYRFGAGSNNGATLAQLLAYRVILLNTGTYSSGAMEQSDMIGLEDWLETTICGMSNIRQGFIANGDEVASIIELKRASFLTGTLGAGFNCSPYRAQGCPTGTDPDSSYCVELIGSDGAVYNPVNPYAAFGNGCPNIYTYSVLFATAGTGNRDWFDFDGTKGVTSFAQVVNDQSGGLSNFRSVIDGYSYHHITETYDPNQNPALCDADSVGRVQAAGNEIISALNWIFDNSFPGFDTDPCEPGDAPDIGGTQVRVNRLYQNEPNPFNPRTALKFSVAARGKVQLAIYDVSGRLVKTLVNDVRDAGLHNVVWDGTDNKSHPVSSGIYWSQLKVGDYLSNKKMVMLK